MKKILVTGGTGFIGIHLVKRLYKLGHSLKLLVRETSDTSPFEELKNIEYSIGDTRDIESLRKAVENVDLIYHLAAYTGIWAKDKSIYHDINVKGTENVAKLALEKDIPLYYVSSFTAIGPTPPEPVDETYEKMDFEMEYEKSKNAGKKVVKEYINKGLKAVIFYPGIVYGPGDFNIFGEMLYDIVRGKFLGCPGDGESMACLSYIPDLVEGMVSAIDRSDIFGEDFILGGENIKFGDYLDLIAEIADQKKPRHFPMAGAKLYAALCELKAKITKKKPYITRPTLTALNYHRSYSSDKAIEKLNYKITPLRQGLEETIKWYQDYIEQEKNKK
jgi:nucleoside-diphosphate-sugar epimerase